MAGKPHFETLDGLRGVAAITVLIGHSSTVLLGTMLVPRQLLAVQFFFVLSGFVIAYSYEQKLLAGMPVRDFIVKRIVRLYPMIILGLVLGFIVYAAGGISHVGSDIARLACGIVNVPCLPLRGGEQLYFTLNQPSWSLFYEMLCYIAFAVLIRFLSNSVLVTLIAVLLPLSVYAAMAFTDHIPFFWHMADAPAAFAIGVLLYRWRRARSGGAGWNVALPLAAAVIAICIVPRSVGWLPDALSFPIFAAVILLGSMQARSGERLRPLVRFLGDISYPLYIVHWPVLRLVETTMASYPVSAQFSVAITASLALAYIALKFFDEPVRRLLQSPSRAARARA